ncbi:preprotein translocase subunit SecY [Arenicella xantha]|uniref:Protein translocase subunit SecY n=1 Tax=Arenicella xantha TaxID=644221 RepID=A0A395JLI4_9GAMM|nr:preprotein translocase subunit SecY [Arenicella xantha]RBP49828.1 protein translocase subunit secY/sec61 alpha [Arenicella xantha]
MAREQAAALAGSGKLQELWSRILFVLGAFIVYRIGTHIPVPGVDPIAIAALFEQSRGSILDVLNMFSGGALSRLSILALGVMPYISASIIMQMLTAVEPRMKQVKQEGEAGRRKIQKWTRYAAVVLATFQAFGVASTVQGQDVGGSPVTLIGGFQFTIVCVLALVAGTMFLVWLGEQITDRGIGNGMSLIIFAGIVAGLPSAIAGTIELASSGEFSPIFVVFLLVAVVVVTAFVVFVERGQRRLTVNYARQQRGNKLMQAPSSYFPLKMNMAGVIPPIFASSIILFPASLVGFFGSDSATGVAGVLRDISTKMQPGELIYTVMYIGMILFFAFFYTALTFDPKEIAENLKKQGAFVPGIRPGQQTARYIDGVVSKLTLVGALYLAVVCLLPELLIVNYNVPFYFGGTSLLIIVVVIMDLMGQVQSHLMSQQYESLMKKTNLTGKSTGGRKRRK